MPIAGSLPRLRRRPMKARPRLSTRSEKSYAGWSDRIDQQRSIQEQVSSLAACLGDDQTTMAGGTVKSPVVGCGCRVVIRTDWIAGTQPLPFKSTL